MTRPLHAIEADLQAARASHQAAEASHRAALKLAADLRARVIGGDETITAADLAAAEHEAEHRALPIPAKLRVIQDLEAEKHVVEHHVFADQVSAERTEVDGNVDQDWADLDVVLDRLIRDLQVQATFDQQTTNAVRLFGMADLTPRIRDGVHGVVVDGALRKHHPQERLKGVFAKAHQFLWNGTPRIQD